MGFVDLYITLAVPILTLFGVAVAAGLIVKYLDK